MTGGELLGWMAAGLTLVTFSMRSMIALRTAAVAANLCFIAFGALGPIYPVLALHLLLLPCNLFRLRQLCRRQSEMAPDVRKPAFIPSGQIVVSDIESGSQENGTVSHIPPRLFRRIRDSAATPPGHGG